MEHREILHVDMDAFFAAVEEKKDPTLKNLPLVIGMNNSKSVVSTANYCARKYGIHSAMPIYKAKLLCKDLIIREPHFSEYEDYHHRIIDLLRTEFTDQIEVCSIDECYLDITDLSKDKTPKYIALMIQNRIRQKIGLSCSIGIAHNKFLAKTATDLHKPNGITTLYRDELMEKF
jgi:DNA polymerase-4